MSLGLLSGYGSDSDNEEETPAPSIQNPANDQLQERLKSLSDGLSLPPPPPPPSQIQEPLPNPMKKVKTKQKSIPGMSKKEMELMMKNAKWMDITTEEVTEEDKSEFEYNTPLPFSREQQAAVAAAAEAGEGAAGPSNSSVSSQPEYD